MNEDHRKHAPEHSLDHVAIAVNDLEEAIVLYRDVLGLSLTEVENVSTEQIKVAIFGHGQGRIELMQPTSPESPVAKFLMKKGEGLHHICVEVPDIEASMALLRERGLPLLDEKPRPGAGGSRVCFIHPKGGRGVLIEMRQGPTSIEATT